MSEGAAPNDDIPTSSTGAAAAQENAPSARPPRKKKSRSKAARATAIARAAAKKAWDEEKAIMALQDLPSPAAQAVGRTALEAFNERRRDAKQRRKLELAQITELEVQYFIDLIQEHGHAWLTPADDPLIRMTAEQVSIKKQYMSYIYQRGAIDTYGRPRGLMKHLTSLHNSIRQNLNALGCSALARSDMGANVASAALDMAQAMRAARAAEVEAKREGRELSAELS